MNERIVLMQTLSMMLLAVDLCFDSVFGLEFNWCIWEQIPPPYGITTITHTPHTHTHTHTHTACMWPAEVVVSPITSGSAVNTVSRLPQSTTLCCWNITHKAVTVWCVCVWCVVCSYKVLDLLNYIWKYLTCTPLSKNRFLRMPALFVNQKKCLDSAVVSWFICLLLNLKSCVRSQRTVIDAKLLLYLHDMWYCFIR